MIPLTLTTLVVEKTRKSLADVDAVVGIAECEALPDMPGRPVPSPAPLALIAEGTPDSLADAVVDAEIEIAD
jgi:hypothetical protein